MCMVTLPLTKHQVVIYVLMNNEMHNSYNQFLFHSFLSALHVSKESSRSSSGARHNILYYTVWYNRAGESSCFEVVGKALKNFYLKLLRVLPRTLKSLT